MLHWWLGWFLAVVVVGAGCSSSGTGERTGEDEWAAEAHLWHDSLRDAQIQEGGKAYARFLSPDVVWDDTAIYAREDAPWLGASAIQAAENVLGPESLTLEPDLFISTEGLVDFLHYDWAPLGNDTWPETQEPAHGVSLMASIGPRGARAFINGMAIEDWRDRRPGWPQADEAEAVAALWTRLWSGTSDDIDILYRDGARVQDTIAGVDVSGLDVIAGMAEAAGTWEITTVGQDAVRGVYPLVRDRSGTKVLEELVLVVDGRDAANCTGDMVVWLALNGGRVVEEIRYWPIERARRCLPSSSLPDGWWTDRPVPTAPTTTLPTEDLDTRTDPLVVGDATVTVYNGTPALNRLLAWGLSRFETAGLTPPSIESVTFTRYSDLCDDLAGRYVGATAGPELTFCLDEQIACWDDSCTNFTPAKRNLVLHEIAHVWMDATLGETAQQEFMDHLGLQVWNDNSLDWDQRAVEHAADTIAWGLMDRDIPAYRIGRPTPDRLAAGLRILTGIDPLPRTDDYSPTQPASPNE